MTISQSEFDTLSNFVLLVTTFGFFTIPPLWILLTFITPKKIINEFLKPPYFNDTEVDIYTSFPTSLYRTGLFGWITLFPSLGKKRNIEHLRKEMPTWFRILIILFMAVLIPTCLIFFFGIIFLTSVDIS